MTEHHHQIGDWLNLEALVWTYVSFLNTYTQLDTEIGVDVFMCMCVHVYVYICFSTVCFCFIDYTKAFECVDHNKLENS